MKLLVRILTYTIASPLFFLIWIIATIEWAFSDGASWGDIWRAYIESMNPYK